MKDLNLPPLDLKSAEGQQITEMAMAVVSGLFDEESVCERAVIDFLSLPDEFIDFAVSQELEFCRLQELDEGHFNPIQLTDVLIGAGRLLHGFSATKAPEARKKELRCFFGALLVGSVIHMVWMIVCTCRNKGLSPLQSLSAIWTGVDFARFYEPEDNPFKEREINVN